jgi:hypothetical protein
MANSKTPLLMDHIALSECDLSQVLAHGSCAEPGLREGLGGLLMLVAIMKANRGPIGIAAAVTLICAVAHKLWFR